MKNSPLNTIAWALHPAWVDTVDQVLTAHFQGERLDLDKIEASLGRPLANEQKPYSIIDGVAVVELAGVIGKKMNLFSRISGGISTEKARADIEAALADPLVKAVVLAIDSHGGTVDGTAELADWIRAQRGGKPIYTYADGSMMSAALWIGTAADMVYGYTTSMLGSLSVVVTHYDRSGQDAKAGIKRTFVTSGKYKRMANDAEPLDTEGRAYLQATVDDIHALFVEGVAANLAMDVDQVAAFAEGKIYTAAQAVELGILSGIKSLDETINAARAAAENSNGGGSQMNAQEIREKFPEAAAALVTEGRNETTATVAEAVQAETERLTGLYTMLHGAEATEKFTTLAAAGLTADQAKALADAGLVSPAKAEEDEDKDAEAAEKARLLQALQETGQDNPGAGADHGPTDFMAVVDGLQADNQKMTKVEAMQQAAKAYPELHKKFLDAANSAGQGE